MNLVRDSSLDFLSGGGEMGLRIREFDWANTALGAPAAWPQPLKGSVRLLLTAGHPMFIWWGPELIQFYNDGYRDCIGAERHPSALGQPGKDCWGEIWDVIGPQVEQIMARRGAVWHENALIPITRNGRLEDVYWTYSYSPIDAPDAPDQVGGVLVICAETTNKVRADQRELSERRRWAQLFARAPGFMALLDGPTHRFEMANESYLRMVGNRDVLGKTVAEVLPEAAAQGFVSLLDEVYRSGKAHISHEAKYVRASGDGIAPRETYVDFIYQPVVDDDDQVIGIFVEGHDVSSGYFARRSLEEGEIRYNSLMESINAGFCVMEVELDEAGTAVDYIFRETNPAFELQTGILNSKDRRLSEIAPGHELFSFDVYGMVARTGESAVFAREAAGLGRWFDISAHRVEGQNPNIVAVLFNDISERKSAERLRQLLLKELDHRVKNSLATVQSIAKLSLSSAKNPEAFIESFLGRIQTLSQAHSLLARDTWGGTKLRDIVLSELAPYLDSHNPCLKLDCADLAVDPKTALALSMALHELTTNAAQHGALSVPSGNVEVHCEVHERDSQRRLRLEWRERNGPPVTPPKLRGFGSRLIAEGLAYELDGDVTLEFESSGVVCKIDVPTVNCRA